MNNSKLDKPLRTRNTACTEIKFYVNSKLVVLNIVNPGKLCTASMDAGTLAEFIKDMQEAHRMLTDSNVTPIWYKGRTIGEAVRNGSIYTFHASEELDEAAQEFARREVEAMNQSWRQIL